MAGNGSCRRNNRSMARLASATSGAERSRSPYCRAKPPASSSALRSRNDKTQRRSQLQQDIPAARGLAGFDITQMLDRDAGLERQISLAHGAAVAPAAQEIADRIDRAAVHVGESPCADYAKGARGCKPQGRRMGRAQRNPSTCRHPDDGFRCAPPILHVRLAAICRIRSAVRSSAGKKVSSASSCSVMSTGVPNTMVVEMKLSTSPLSRSLKGIATLSAETGPERAGIR